jgi:two-component system chemotaxis response regulator CheB
MIKRKETARVLIVDDSAAVRQTLLTILKGEPGIEVMAAVSDPFAAARAMQAEMPDVIILDIEMPRMDGITFLRKIMSQKPVPVIICSAATEQGNNTFDEAMAAGAVDVIAKPRIDTSQFLMEARVRVCDAVRAASRAKLMPRNASRAGVVEKKLSADVMLPPPVPSRAPRIQTDQIICIGASTGGTEALLNVIAALPFDSPGVVVVQHMPEGFTASFAARLNRICEMEVKEAVDGDTVVQGRVLIAPGNRHMILERTNTHYRVSIKEGPLVSRHRPSVDVLFRSAAKAAGSNAIGVILTGMGDDGAKGMLEMHQAGATTIAQDEQSCVVFGMPKSAVELGGVTTIARLDQIGSLLSQMKREPA